MATNTKAPSAPKTSTASHTAPLAASNGKATSNGLHHAERLDIGLEQKNMDATIDICNDMLANYAVLAVKVHNYHWNVVGMQFNDLHKFFEKLYDQLNEESDEVAERIRSLAGRPLGNMASFIASATIEEETRTGLDARSMLQTLLGDEENLIRQMRDAIDEIEDRYEDKGTSDFLTGLMEQREKNAWMVRSLCS